jgi:hypothetical protein
MTREYVGVDLHQRFFQACAISITGDRLWEQRFPRTADGIGRFSVRVSSDSAMAVEAMGPTWAFVDALAPTGAALCVVDPRKTKLKAGHCDGIVSCRSIFRHLRFAPCGKCVGAGTKWCASARASRR